MREAGGVNSTVQVKKRKNKLRFNRHKNFTVEMGFKNYSLVPTLG